MTKRDEAVFVETFDELEAEGFFDELRKKARARKLQGKVRAGVAPTMLGGSSTTVVVKEKPVKTLKADKKSGKKIPVSVSNRKVADKVSLVASKK